MCHPEWMLSNELVCRIELQLKAWTQCCRIQAAQIDIKEIANGSGPDTKEKSQIIQRESRDHEGSKSFLEIARSTLKRLMHRLFGNSFLRWTALHSNGRAGSIMVAGQPANSITSCVHSFLEGAFL